MDHWAWKTVSLILTVFLWLIQISLYSILWGADWKLQRSKDQYFPLPPGKHPTHQWVCREKCCYWRGHQLPTWCPLPILSSSDLPLAAGALSSTGTCRGDPICVDVPNEGHGSAHFQKTIHIAVNYASSSEPKFGQWGVGTSHWHCLLPTILEISVYLIMQTKKRYLFIPANWPLYAQLKNKI